MGEGFAYPNPNPNPNPNPKRGGGEHLLALVVERVEAVVSRLTVGLAAEHLVDRDVRERLRRQGGVRLRPGYRGSQGAGGRGGGAPPSGRW